MPPPEKMDFIDHEIFHVNKNNYEKLNQLIKEFNRVKAL